MSVTGNVLRGMLCVLTCACSATDEREDPSADVTMVTCDEPLPRPVLAACVVPVVVGDVVLPTQGVQQPLFVPGTVQELGEGAPPFECFFDHERALGDGLSSDSKELDEARWLRVQADGGQDTLISVVAPSVQWPVSVGDFVTVDFRREGGHFGPVIGHLELRDADGALLLWLAFGGRVGELDDPAEIALARGTEVCRNASECFQAWTQHELSVLIGRDQTRVGYGEQQRLGAFTFTHGGADEQVGGSTSCSDAFVAWAAAALWRTEPESFGAP